MNAPVSRVAAGAASTGVGVRRVTRLFPFLNRKSLP